MMRGVALLLLLIHAVSGSMPTADPASSSYTYEIQGSTEFMQTNDGTFTLKNATSTKLPNSAMAPSGFKRTRPYAFVDPRRLAFTWSRQKNDIDLPTNLIMFTGDNCDHCDEMEPNLVKLEKEFNLKIARLNVWRSQINFKLFEKLDPSQKCGGLPYFYNTKTKQRICGATTFGNLRAWARDKPCNMFFYVPSKSKETTEENKSVGLLGRVSGKLNSMKEEGKEGVKRKVEEKLEERKGTDKIKREEGEGEKVEVKQ